MIEAVTISAHSLNGVAGKVSLATSGEFDRNVFYDQDDVRMRVHQICQVSQEELQHGEVEITIQNSLGFHTYFYIVIYIWQYDDILSIILDQLYWKCSADSMMTHDTAF